MIDFLKYRWISLLFSLCIIAVSVGTYVYRGYAFTYSVDFAGGTQILLKFEKPMSSVDLKDILDQGGWQGATMREFSPQEILVRVKEYESDAKGLAERIKETINAALTDNTVTILQSDAVGPGVGAELRWKSIRAIVIALLLMLAYVAYRFWSVAFALGAVVALFHDALVMLATFLLLDREISASIIAALLAVLGYSINDTIVIFAQIRDNLKKMPLAPLHEIVNTSINFTLRRTLLTSISTGLAVGSMFVLGGEILRDFSLALLIGIIFGTYSSIYIASPVMMLLYRKKSVSR